jgi:signal transduction histidine kinase
MKNILNILLLSVLLTAPALLVSAKVGPLQKSRKVTPKEEVEKRVDTYDLDSLESLLVSFRKDGDSLAAAITLNVIGSCYSHDSDFSKAIKSQRQAEIISSALKDTLFYVQNICDLSGNLIKVGGYSAASDYLYRGLSWTDRWSQRNTNDGMCVRSSVFNGLGHVYKYLDDGIQAEEYFRKSLDLDMKSGNDIGVAKNYSTLGNVYEHRNMLDSTYVMYNKSLDYDVKAGSGLGIGICHNHLGQIMMHIGDMDESLSHYQIAYKYLKEAHDKWNLIRTTLSLAWIYLERNDLPDARKYIVESEQLLGNNRSYGHLEEIHYAWSEYYRKQNQYQKAFQELEISYSYRDSIAAQKTEQEAARARIQYERDENESKIAQVNKEKERVQAARKKVMITGSVIVVVLFLLLLSLYIYSRQQKKINRILEEDADAKNKFFAIISHDLKNPVIAQNNIMDQLMGNLGSIPPDVLEQTLQELSKSSKSLKSLLESLLNWSRLQVGKVKIEPMCIDLRTVAEDAIKPLSEQISGKGVKVMIDIPGDTFAFADLNMVSTVIRNLVSNAVKFSYKEGEIHISSQETGNGIMVSVADNGVGMSDATLKSLFVTLRKSSQGTSGEKGTGLGLIICEEMLKLDGGKLSVKSEEGKGTTFSFALRRTN